MKHTNIISCRKKFYLFSLTCMTLHLLNIISIKFPFLSSLSSNTDTQYIITVQNKIKYRPVVYTTSAQSNVYCLISVLLINNNTFNILCCNKMLYYRDSYIHNGDFNRILAQ